MKSKIAILLAIFSTLLQTFAQSTAFTYQGRLNNNGSVANGNYDLVFTLYATNATGTTLAGPVTKSAVAVTNGLFTTLVDFVNVFAGTSNYWLEIAVSTNGANNYSTLAPRQQLTPVPYAIMADNVSGTLTPSNLPSVLGGSGNSVGASYGTIGGGYNNSIQMNSAYSFLGGGYDNSIQTQAYYSFLGGGQFNSIQTNANYSFLGGGYENYIEAGANYSFIGGGSGNSIQPGAYYSVVVGGQNNSIQTSAYYSFVGGGQGNSIQPTAIYSFLGGGYDNSIQLNAIFSIIGCSQNNSIQTNAQYSFLGSGAGNSIQTGAEYSFIGGGQDNFIQPDAEYCFLGGGSDDSIGTFSEYSVVGGGQGNSIQSYSENSTIGGGKNNEILPGANTATIPGGYGNVATNCAFAAGFYAHAINSGSFVWGDNSGAITTSAANDSVTFRASGGYRFFTGTGTGGATLAANATSWTTLSDRNAKKNFEPVDTVAVLDKLAAIPIQQWNYKWEKNDDVPNIGPMAQDFKHAFYPGRDDKGISTLEFDGVELAAIQGLNQKLNAKDAEIQKLQNQNNSLAVQLEQLAVEVKLLADKK